MLRSRVFLKQTKNNFSSNRNKPKRDLLQLCFGLFCESKNKNFGLFQFVSVFRTYIETTETNRTVSKQTKTNRNNPKFSEIFQNMLSIKMFRLVFCLFWFNRNIKTLSESTETNCFETSQNKPKHTGKTLYFLTNIPKYAAYQTVSVGLLFVSVQSKHRNSLFWYRRETTETNVLFRIVLKLVSVPVSVVSIETSFEGHPTQKSFKSGPSSSEIILPDFPQRALFHFIIIISFFSVPSVFI
jgi:hypothetical protein